MIEHTFPLDEHPARHSPHFLHQRILEAIPELEGTCVVDEDVELLVDEDGVETKVVTPQEGMRLNVVYQHETNELVITTPDTIKKSELSKVVKTHDFSKPRTLGEPIAEILRSDASIEEKFDALARLAELV